MNEKKITIELPLVSIIVLTYNGKGHLKECFESLENLNYPKDKYEVIMADNASSDGSVEYVKKNFSSIKILLLDKNYGYAGGNNRGSEIANGRYIVFLNQDIIVNNNWLIELIESMQRNTDIKVCGSKNLQKGENKVLTFGGYLTVVGGGTSENTLDAPQERKKEKKPLLLIGYAVGSSLLVEKKAFEYLGSFDETYFMYDEECDLCWRAWLYGYKVAVLPSAIVWRNADDNSKKREKFLFYIIKNQLMSVLKNFEIHNLIYAIIISFLYNLFQILKYLLLRRPKSIIDIIKAHLFVMRNLPEVLKKRKIIQKNRKISDKELYKMELILLLLKSIKKEIDLSKRDYHGI
ncbi:hypothetical protein MSIBF_A730001 [groundwater metagenome]|uniref:Glycosyltransferase 2-like domain-containing protein n=1 Tax=groundwater metagenome TaxID=717931 RepID=A0A098EEJ2_9ZZZZ